MARVMAPDGTIGEIPDEQLAAAVRAGARVLSDEDMASLFNRQELERRSFEENWAKQHRPIPRRLPRRYR